MSRGCSYLYSVRSTPTNNFTYTIHQGTEESDLAIIRRDLTSGRLYANGARLVGGSWSNLLFGDQFSHTGSLKQKHELTYIRSTCTCLVCMVRTAVARAEVSTLSDSHDALRGWTDLDNHHKSTSTDEPLDLLSSARTPDNSAMANFVEICSLPPTSGLMLIGGSSSSTEFEIGSVVRLNSRASAKLKFTNFVRRLLGHHAYTGPISHEEMFRRVTTIGVHYYLNNKGKRERKVYIQGELIRLPVKVGVAKLGTRPMYSTELHSSFLLYREQTVFIHVGEIVLEGNSLGSFIRTGIRYYIGFGEECGVCAVFPNKSLGKARQLGINELLLHHHMVDDLEVKCL